MLCVVSIRHGYLLFFLSLEDLVLADVLVEADRFTFCFFMRNSVLAAVVVICSIDSLSAAVII
jgi:hypothetical protein